MDQTDYIVTPAKTGESCPCCGQPIKTKDPALLWLPLPAMPEGKKWQGQETLDGILGRK